MAHKTASTHWSGKVVTQKRTVTGTGKETLTSSELRSAVSQLEAQAKKVLASLYGAASPPSNNELEAEAQKILASLYRAASPRSNELEDVVARLHRVVSDNAMEFMGGKHIFKTRPQSRVDIHSTIMKGLPYEVLDNIIARSKTLTADEVTNAVGISTRTLRRQKEFPRKTMPPELASKTWMFAETLAKASDVFGGREAAERWMSMPAMGLDGARPIDLLRTLQGAELVNEFLGRIEQGVYN